MSNSSLSGVETYTYGILGAGVGKEEARRPTPWTSQARVSISRVNI